MHGIPVGVFTPVRVDTLAGGAIVAVLAEMGTLEKLAAGVLRSLAIAIPLLIVAFAFLTGSRLEALQAVKYPLITYVYSAVISAVMTHRSVASPFELRALRYTGKYSYAMYVMHMVFVEALASTHLALPIRIGLTLAGTFAAALLSWYLLEAPFLRLKEHFVVPLSEARTAAGAVA